MLTMATRNTSMMIRLSQDVYNELTTLSTFLQITPNKLATAIVTNSINAMKEALVNGQTNV